MGYSWSGPDSSGVEPRCEYTKVGVKYSGSMWSRDVWFFGKVDSEGIL